MGIFSSFILVVRGGVGSGGLAHLPHGARDEAEAANKAKEGCPVSKLFNAEITLDARLES